MIAPDVRAALRSLAVRIQLSVSRGIVTLSDDDHGLQEIQARFLDGETRGRLERVQQYGLTSRPHRDAELVGLFVGGNRDHGLVLGVDDRRHRLQGLEEGEVALYTDEGDQIILKRGRIVEIVAGAEVKLTAGEKATVEAPEVEVVAETQVTVASPVTRVLGNLEVLGTVSDLVGAGGSSMGAMRDVYNIHTHDENDNEPGEPPHTDPPNQQMTGTSDTGGSGGGAPGGAATASFDAGTFTNPTGGFVLDGGSFAAA